MRPILAILAAARLAEPLRLGALPGATPRSAPNRHAPCRLAADEGDSLLLQAVESLRAGQVAEATARLSEARAAYDASGGPTAAQTESLTLVQTSLDGAAQRLRATRLSSRPPASAPGAPLPAPSAEARAARMERIKLTGRGDGALSRAVEAIGRGDTVAANSLLTEARESYRAAGEDVEREREVRSVTVSRYVRSPPPPRAVYII